MPSAAQNKTRAALLFIYLDGFRRANDAHGDDACNHFLKFVAQRMGSSIRGTDTVARLGGDEFIIILNGIRDVGAATLVAGKTVAAISGLIHYSEFCLNISSSIGLAIFPDHSADPEDMPKKAW